MSEISTPIYKVKASAFEGPLDVLLSLIEQRRLFINDISLAEVTNDYIAFVQSFSNQAEEKHIANISYFILIASTLILIKSKSLLPNLELTEDENEKISDLEVRLKLYQTVKDAGIEIRNNFGVNVIFYPNERIWSEPLFSPDPLMTVSNVQNCIFNIINNAPKKLEVLPEVEVKKIININEIIDSLTDRIQNALNLSFREFTTNNDIKDKEEAKLNVIISFLAMLELVREGIIDVIQNVSFGDIEMNKQNILIN